MKRDNDRQTAIILSIVGIVPVIWLALLIAPSISGGLPEMAANLPTLFDNPFSIKLCGDSLKTVLILLLCYGMGIGIYFSTRKNYRRREEHGSAKWGNVRAIDKKYRQKPLSENKLMTQNVCIGLNAKKHRRNLNTLVCGGSGAGKTSDEVIMKLNDQLNMIRDNIGTEQEISITYFVPDDKKSGGAYLTHSGIVKKIDEFERKLIMQDETVIPTEQISVIQGEMFKGLYE